MARMMFVSSRPVRATKASISADALLAQQLAVGAVAVDDQHAGELFAHVLAAGGVAVDDGHPLLDVLQFLDEVVGHPAGADDHDVVGAWP